MSGALKASPGVAPGWGHEKGSSGETGKAKVVTESTTPTKPRPGEGRRGLSSHRGRPGVGIGGYGSRRKSVLLLHQVGSAKRKTS